MNEKTTENFFSPFVDGYCDVENQLHEHILRSAERLSLKEESEKLGLVDREQFEKRRKRIQEYFLEAIGGLPEERSPLNPKVRGIIEREKYRVEKIIYESQPRFYVTSLLYVPKETKEKTPAILVVCGHYKTSKADPNYQKMCIELVRNGFTVLVMDPLGQGERIQYWDPKTRRGNLDWGSKEHMHAGFQCVLIGDNIARYLIWDGVRGIDYLTSRKEVDEEKIGVTGNSGGGTQTAYLMLTERRIRAAAPCTWITSIDKVVKTIGPQDSEQNIFGAMKEGLNHDDYIAAFAPKPVLIGAAAYDYFPIEGALQTLERAKKIYHLYNAEENVAIHIGRHLHIFSDELREAVVNWFKVHLKNEPPDFKTEKTEVEPIDSLNVTDSGQVLGEISGARTILDLNLEQWNEKKPKRTLIESEDELTLYISKVRAELRMLLGINGARDTMYPRIISTIDLDGLKAEKIFFFSEPGIALTAVMIYGKNAGKDVSPILVLFEDGTNDISREKEIVRNLAVEGNRVLVLDVRGVGGVKVRKINPLELTAIGGTEFKITYGSLLLGKSLLGMRVFDVLRGIDYLRSREDVDFGRLRLYAKGQAALYGFFASVLSQEVKSLTLEDMLYSYESVIRTRIYDRKYGEPLLVHGLLEHFDIVDLLPSLHNRDYGFINLRNAEQRVISPSELEDNFIGVIKKHYPILGDIEKKIDLQKSGLGKNIFG